MSVQRKRVDAFLRLAEEELQAARQLVHGAANLAGDLQQDHADLISYLHGPLGAGF